MNFLFFKQLDSMDYGPTCLRMVAKHYKRNISLQTLRDKTQTERQGEKLNARKTWCDETKIEFTPTFFINGYKLPKNYKIDEVKYFLEK